ncbi:MAG: PKD domain-containing protein [Anaerolineae bacterium]|nr:PKD domain-containing protein [Anaerolineae bacterium]
MHNKTRFIAVLLISLIGIALVFAMSESPVAAWRIEDAAPESPTQELDVTKQANAAYVETGGQITYTLAVTNTESFAVTATITDILPANVTLGGGGGTIILPPGTIILPPGLIVWSPVTLDPGEVWMETFVVTVTAGYAGPLTNTLQVTTAEGPGGEDMVVVTAEEAIAGLTSGNDGPTHLGTPTTLTATVAAGSDVVYTWDFGDGDSGEGASVTHTYPHIGAYTATVTATNHVGAMSATSIVTITDVPVTGLTASNDGPTQLGQPTTFTAEVAAGSNVTYTWVFGDGESAYGRVVSHVYAAGGSYTAIVTARNSVNSLTASTRVNVGAYIYLPLVLRNWSTGSITPTPTITPTPSPQDVYVLPNDSHYMSGNTLYVVGEVQNDGSDYAVLVQVPVQLFDSSNQLLGTYPTYISLDLPAGEKSCFHLVINNPPVGWASIGFDVLTYYSFADQPWPNLTIYDDVGEYQTDFTYKISGMVRNDASQSAGTVLIEGALYNSDDKIVGCRLAPATDPSLPPGETSPFELFYGYDGDYSDITTYRLQADSIP